MPERSPSSPSGAQLRDGSRVSGQAEHVARSVAIDRDMAREEREWIASLRAKGVKAAHPDDGWVDRDVNRVHLCYPQFDDGLEVGDVLALGWPWRATRLVRIVDTDDNPFSSERPWYLHFEAVA